MNRSTDIRRIKGARGRGGEGAGARTVERRGFLRLGAAALGGALLPVSSVLAGQTAAGQVSPITATDLGGVWVFRGPAWNALALPGAEGALMIDGGDAANAEALLTSVRGA